MARGLLAPIPFREVFVILALFLPQLTFVDGASARQDLWSSPTVRKHGLLVDITPTAAGLQCMNIALRFPRGHKQLSSALHTYTVHMGCQVGKALPTGFAGG